MQKPEPTTRFYILPSLMCNIKCKMCYHLHKYEQWPQSLKQKEDVYRVIDAGIQRGNDWMDVTGGEPTVYPYIVDVLEYARSCGLKTCIITNGIVAKDRLRELLPLVDDWLVSRHGCEQTHNFVTDSPIAYKRQYRFLEMLSVADMGRLRFNCVITKFNYRELPQIAQEMAMWCPIVVNFINMNPHHEWMSQDIATQDVIADLREVEPYLNEAIAYLQATNIFVNVRYYPMCRIDARYWRCIANDLHVVWKLDDSVYGDINCEWDYQISPKTYDAHLRWSLETSRRTEEQGEPCNRCTLHTVCGGINRHFHRVSTQLYGEVCTPIEASPDSQQQLNFYTFRWQQIS